MGPKHQYCIVVHEFFLFEEIDCQHEDQEIKNEYIESEFGG